MKKENQFIIETIKKWLIEFKGIQVRYAYEDTFDYNIVTVAPANLFKDNSFKNAVYNLWITFENDFQSNLIVSEPDESYDMSNILFDSTKIIN